MSEYVFQCTVLGLLEPHSVLLKQAGCRVSGEEVEFDLTRTSNEKSEEFRDRGARWIGRELSRVNALTGKLFKASSLRVNPSPGSITVNVAGVWDHQDQIPPSHSGWSNDATEFRLSAWDIARHTDDHVLRFVMLDSICESAMVPQDWIDESSWPPRFAEVRLIRNLLVHGSMTPNYKVRLFLERCTKSVPINRFAGRRDHLELARMRSPHLMSAVWQIVINDCVDVQVDLRCAEPATLRGILLIDKGPYPAER